MEGSGALHRRCCGQVLRLSTSHRKEINNVVTHSVPDLPLHHGHDMGEIQEIALDAVQLPRGRKNNTPIANM